MTINVRFFARLREQIGRSETAIDASGVETVDDAWRRATSDQPWPDRVMAAVNHEYVKPGHPVRDGDEVAFFPPVTGG